VWQPIPGADAQQPAGVPRGAQIMPSGKHYVDPRETGVGGGPKVIRPVPEAPSPPPAPSAQTVPGFPGTIKQPSPPPVAAPKQPEQNATPVPKVPATPVPKSTAPAAGQGDDRPYKWVKVGPGHLEKVYISPEEAAAARKAQGDKPRVIYGGQQPVTGDFDAGQPAKYGTPDAPAGGGGAPEPVGHEAILVPPPVKPDEQPTTSSAPPRPNQQNVKPSDKQPPKLPAVDLPKFPGPPGEAFNPQSGLGVAIEPAPVESEGKAATAKPAPKLKAPDETTGPTYAAPPGGQKQRVYGRFRVGNEPINVPPEVFGGEGVNEPAPAPAPPAPEPAASAESASPPAPPAPSPFGERFPEGGEFGPKPTRLPEIQVRPEQHSEAAPQPGLPSDEPTAALAQASDAKFNASLPNTLGGTMVRAPLQMAKSAIESITEAGRGTQAATTPVQVGSSGMYTEADAFAVNTANQAATEGPLKFIKDMVLGGVMTGGAKGSVGAAGGRLLQDEAAGLGTPNAVRPRASAEEITRAAKESPGMTQKQLRGLYDELGLTGRPPSELAAPSLADQPQAALDAARELKLRDREALNTLSPEDRKAFQTGKLRGDFRLPSQEAGDAANAEFAPIKKEVTKAEKAFDKETAAGNRQSLFDLSPEALNKPPDVEQFPLPRLAEKITDRLKPAFEGGAGLKRLETAAGNAPQENWGWYNLQQARQNFIDIHGPQKGEQAWNAFLDSVAGTSMVNPIDNNIRSSTAYLQRILQGKPLPQSLEVIDPLTGQTTKALAGAMGAGYGAKSQIQHADRVREYLGNVFDPVSNPKPISYRTNLGGNYGPRTVDTHDIRNMLGMPYGKEAIGENSSLLPGEYAALENLGAKAAERAGTAQAPQQAATWVGGGEYTGLKSFPAPFMEALNRRIQVTARVRGERPEETWSKAITGRAPLLSGAAVAGLGGAAGVIGSLTGGATEAEAGVFKGEPAMMNVPFKGGAPKMPVVPPPGSVPFDMQRPPELPTSPTMGAGADRDATISGAIGGVGIIGGLLGALGLSGQSSDKAGDLEQSRAKGMEELKQQMPDFDRQRRQELPFGGSNANVSAGMSGAVPDAAFSGVPGYAEGGQVIQTAPGIYSPVDEDADSEKRVQEEQRARRRELEEAKYNEQSHSDEDVQKHLAGIPGFAAGGPVTNATFGAPAQGPFGGFGGNNTFSLPNFTLGHTTSASEFASYLTNLMGGGKQSFGQFGQNTVSALGEMNRYQSQFFQQFRGFADGGLIHGQGTGTSDSNIIRVSRGEFVVTADGSNLGDAIQHFAKGFAKGGLVGGFAGSLASIPGYASGGPVTAAASAADPSDTHSLDIRTDSGTFTAKVSDDTMTALRNSSLGGKLTQTGQRPTWYS